MLSTYPEALSAGFALTAVLALASIIGWVLGRRYRGSPGIRNLNQRIRSWWLIAGAGMGALFAGPVALILLFALISGLSLREVLIQTGISKDRLATYLCFLVVIPVQYLWIALDAYLLFLVWIPLWGLLVSPVLSLRAGPESFLRRVAGMLWATVACVYGISHIPALLMLRTPDHQDRTPLLMMFVVVISQISDVLQYLWGKLLGRRRVTPIVSPSKTIEGLIGGVLSATAAGALLSMLTPFSRLEAAMAACIIAITGFLGGLVMSALKRDLGIKDWSGLIAGHGGMLDRMDALCFCAPVFFHLTRLYLVFSA